MGDKDTPAWGSPEFNKAIEEHDEKADPEREAKGHKYTKKADKPAATKPTPKSNKTKDDKKK